jgi:hypothetical protein
MKDLPILQKATIKNNVTKELMIKTIFLKIYQFLLKNVEYLYGIFIHTIYCYLSKIVDSKFLKL